MDTGPSGDIVVVENLTKRFGAVEAVSGLDFAVPNGGITALLGANGAGKSTTIAILLGLLKPTSGRVTVMGVDMTRDRYRALAAMNSGISRTPYERRGSLPKSSGMAPSMRLLISR